MRHHRLHTQNPILWILQLEIGLVWISKWWVNDVELCSRSDHSSVATTLHVGWIGWIGLIGVGGPHQLKTIWRQFWFVSYISCYF